MIQIKLGKNHVCEVPAEFGDYRYVKRLSEGGFSHVAMIQHTLTQEYFACKIISQKLLEEDGSFKQFEQEVSVLEQMDHPNIIKLIQIIQSGDIYFLILEYCKNGNLAEFLLQNGPFSESAARLIFLQLLNVVQHLHNKDIVHRDIKPENILLDAHFNMKLADLGLSHTIKENQNMLNTFCGSIYYAAPEILNQVEYDGKLSDSWSVGVVLYCITTGCLPWKAGNQVMVMNQIKAGIISTPTNLSETLFDLIQRLLCPDPNTRMTIQQALDHCWVNNRKLTRIPQSQAELPLPFQSPMRKDSISTTTSNFYSPIQKPSIMRPIISAASINNNNAQSNVYKFNQKPLNILKRQPLSSKRRRISQPY